MIELDPGEFLGMIPLLKDVKQKVLPHAICQGTSPGRIFVDQRNQPNIVLLWSALGYYILAGEPRPTIDFDEARRVLLEVFVPATQAVGENSFILIPAHVGWQEHLSQLLPGREVIEIYRRPFHFNLARYLALPSWKKRIPPGYTLELIHADLVRCIGTPPGWASPESFLSDGLGVALLDGDNLVSLCTSVFASHEYMEIDIHTEEKYQRQGFSWLCAAAFIEECLRRDKQPNWECFWENQASTALAEKLGFQVELDYPVYYWEE